jgi:hypothetical protein
MKSYVNLDREISGIKLRDFKAEGIKHIKCIATQEDYCFYVGKEYQVHYGTEEGPYVFGSGFSGDLTELGSLTQEICNKFQIIE